MGIEEDNNDLNKFLLEKTKQFLRDNYSIREEWKMLNQSFFDILTVEKSIRRQFYIKKVLDDNVIKLIEELDKVLSKSSDSFYVFQSEKILDFKLKQYDMIADIRKKIKLIRNKENNAIDKLFETLPKTKNVFWTCSDLFENLFPDIVEKDYYSFMDRIINSEKSIEWQNKNIAFFKSVFSTLEQLIIEFNSYNNYVHVETLKKEYQELENETLSDFILNYLDRNTTIFVLAKLIENEDNKIEFSKHQFIFAKYSDFFPAVKLLSEVRNFLEHRTNSYNVDLSIFDSSLIFFLSNNIFMMIFSVLFYLKNDLKFDDLI